MPHRPAHRQNNVSLNRSALQATLHCLTGCAIGEILGLALATVFGWGTASSIALATALAFVFGYSTSLGPIIRAGVPPRKALSLAFAGDTLSITTMEIVDNAIVLIVPGAMEAGLTDGLFWWSLGLGLALAFVAAFPVNRALIARGRGHAVMHAHH
jgi:hypothetical protein